MCLPQGGDGKKQVSKIKAMMVGTRDMRVLFYLTLAKKGVKYRKTHCYEIHIHTIYCEQQLSRQCSDGR